MQFHNNAITFFDFRDSMKFIFRLFLVISVMHFALVASFRVENSVTIVFELAQGISNFTFDLYRVSITKFVEFAERIFLNIVLCLFIFHSKIFT